MFRYSAHDDADTLNLFDEGFQGRTALSLFTVNALSQLPSVDMNWTNRYKARKKLAYQKRSHMSLRFCCISELAFVH